LLQKSRDLLAEMRAIGAEIVVPCGDHVMRVPADKLTRLIVRKQGYQRDIFQRAIALAEERGGLRAGGVLLDVGANIGMHTVYGHLSGRFSRVVSVEASERNFQFLVSNIHENGFDDRTSTIHCAGGRTAGTAKLSRDPTNGLKATLVKRKAEEEAGFDVESVGVRPVDSILAELNIDPNSVGMSWIDVMGFEVEVLAGMPKVIAAGQPLVFEYSNGWFGADAKQEMLDLLRQGPYSAFVDLKAEGLNWRPLAEIRHFSVPWTNLLFVSESQA
jgi:FkbM family methyltransferase